MKPKDILPYTDDWELYENGKDYNYAIDLYDTVNTNERFYRGDQWHGVNSAGLPTPVFNIFKRIINYYSATIMQSSVKMRYSFASPTASSGVTRQEAENAAQTLCNIADERWEKLKMDSLLSDAITDAAITGDAIAYTYWDPTIRTGQMISGNFVTALIDNTSVFFGDPNNRSVEKQPYILIAQRETVADLKRQAEKNGVSKAVIDKIVSDSETAEQTGDRAANEPLHTKCISLIKLWKDENGHIWFRKSTKGAVITNATDTKLTRYPIAYFNWTPVKNSWHGQAVATGLTENQIFINKSFAMVMKHMMDTAFSKVVYDNTVIEEWSNRFGEAVAVNGPVESVAKVISSGQMQSGMLDVINMAISATKEFMGATDTALGEASPTNTSAILALQNASNMPLENIKRALYSFVEDIGVIWLDFILAYYDDRRLVSTKNGENAEFAFKKYKNCLFDCRIDVGASSYWSEIAALNTLDNLLQSGHITFLQYLKRLPENIIPAKQELIKEAEASAERNTLNATQNID